MYRVTSSGSTKLRSYAFCPKHFAAIQNQSVAIARTLPRPASRRSPYRRCRSLRFRDRAALHFEVDKEEEQERKHAVLRRIRSE